jgi:polar amino acid transport system substrate-binding protein
MLPRLVFAALLAAAAAVAGAAESPELRLASDEWPPFTGGPDSERAAVELVHTALDRAGIHAVTTIVDWKDVEAGIRRGDFDGSAAMWLTERREQDLLFSIPYLENRLVLIGRAGSDVSATRIDDLAGARVAAVGRYAYGERIERAEGVLFVNTRNDQDSLDRLLAGEVDYLLVDELVARHLIDFQPEEVEKNLEIGLRPLASRLLHFAIRRDVPDATAIIDAFNREIRAMQGDGSYVEILQVGWIRIDADGDGLYELMPYGDYVGEYPPGTVYDVFGDLPDDGEAAEKQRIIVQGSIYEGWDAIPDRYKQPPSQGGPTSWKYGTTVMTLKF